MSYSHAAPGVMLGGAPRGSGSQQGRNNGGRILPLRAADIHRAVNWPQILAGLGVDPKHLTGKHGPCPMCGGKDRYRFTNHLQRGSFICSGCSPKGGDGFTLLSRLKGWTFRQALEEVARAAGIRTDLPAAASPIRAAAPAPDPALPATPSRRVQDLLRTACTPDLVTDVRAYLESRCLWPLPAGCTLRGHALADDYREGRFPAMVGIVSDREGNRVTAHVTFLKDGRKRPGEAPRKILSPMTGRTGCAVRLVPHDGVLGIAEGIETALSAQQLHGVPTWAALNAGMLAKFDPPADVHELRIFCDRDVAGLEAAAHLIERIAGRIKVRLQTPPDGAKDFNDVLTGRARYAAA